jgi:hypothetical protein
VRRVDLRVAFALAGVLGALLALTPRAAGLLPRAAIRALDGEEYFAGEPIWLCLDPANASTAIPGWIHHRLELVGTDATGHAIRRETVATAPDSVHVDAQGQVRARRGGEFGQTFGFVDPSGRTPLVTSYAAIPVGAWELHGAVGGDGGRVLARFRVVEPRGVERSVRDGLARAARLAGPDGQGRDAAQAARLYEVILERYPRTAYLSVVYAGLWRVRAHTRFGPDPDRWLEEVFARFHDTCFGMIALDQWVKDMGEVRARSTVAHLVGLYPDTPLSKAAARYLQAR